MEQNTSCRMVARCWLPIIHPTRTRKLASSPAPCSLRFLKKQRELPISELAVLAFPDPHHRGENDQHPGRAAICVLHLSFVAMTSTWNSRLELGSSTIPMTITFPVTNRVLPLIWVCRTMGA